MAAHRKISAEAKQELLRRADDGQTGAQLAAWLLAEHGVKVAKQSLNRLVRELRQEAAKPDPKRARKALTLEKRLGRHHKAFPAGETVPRNDSKPSQPAIAAPTNSRARVRPGHGCSIDERVDWCVHLMSTGEWNGYVTRCELSAAWGVKETSIANDAAEASRRLRLNPEELAQARIAHAAWLRKVRDEALQLQNNITGLPDFGSAIKAAELVAKFEGHDLGVQKIELTGKDGGPIQNVDVTKMSDADLERLAGIAAAGAAGKG